ncbi:MAG: ABC transporter ATP-binding protein, partial [Pyrinomonadaceae bacterium]
QMRGELKHLQHRLGTTTVYVTHDQAEAMTLGHRVAVMNKGRLQQFAAPLEIYNRPANRFVAEFVGSPSMNFLDGEVDSQTGKFIAGELTLIPDQAQLETVRRVEGKVTLGIRPEHIQVSLAQNNGWQPASVYVSELMGSETFVFLEMGAQRIVARASGDFRAETGGTVWVEFDMSKSHFFDSLGTRR